jgi:hypothetical protein
MADVAFWHKSGHEIRCLRDSPIRPDATRSWGVLLSRLLKRSALPYSAPQVMRAQPVHYLARRATQAPPAGVRPFVCYQPQPVM